MAALHFIIFSFLAYHFTIFTFTTYNRYYSDSLTKTETSFLSKNISNPYQFDDPLTAYYILQQLDIFEQEELLAFQNRTPRAYDNYVMGTIPDDEYCDKHRAHIVYHPETIFEQMNIVTSLSPVSLMKKTVIPSIGSDIQPNMYSRRKSNRHEYVFEMRPDINVFFSPISLYMYRRIGKQFSCLTQASSATPGHSQIYRKDFVAERLVQYAKGYQDKPQCFNFDKLFPQTWVLYNEEQCQEFFRALDSPEYQKEKQEKGIVYLRKIGAGVHEGRGVFSLNDKEEEKMRTLYQNGTLCGIKRKNYMIQRLIHNPLLLNGHKFDFRTFLLIASSNPVMIYFYKEAQLRVSLHNYAPNATERGAMLTNVALAKSLFRFARRNGTYNGMTVDQLKASHLWNLERLQEYLLEEGLITDENWLDNYLRPEFKKAILHLIRLAQPYFDPKSSVYHIMGVDFMLDTNLNLWFIESNAKPALEALSKENGKFKTKMLVDHYEIIFGLMRSRMKRMITFVNKIIRSGDYKIENGKELLLFDLEGKREEFRRITRNYYEKEFEPSKDNWFEPVVDDNKVGSERYFGLLAEECI